MILFSTWSGSIAFGCTCVTQDFQSASESAKEIFLGQIISVGGSFENSPQKTTFRVLKKWKGDTDNEITIYSGITGCDDFFKYDTSTYLIYADKEDLHKRMKDYDNRLVASQCSRSISNKYAIENNWFRDDQNKLNSKFEAISLNINPWLGYEYIILGTVILIGIITLIKYFY